MLTEFGTFGISPVKDETVYSHQPWLHQKKRNVVSAAKDVLKNVFLIFFKLLVFPLFFINIKKISMWRINK